MTLNPSGSLNYDNDLVQKVVYNENNDPVFIDGEKGDVGFQYGLTGMRQMVTYGGQSAPLEYPENNKWQGRCTKYYNEDGSFEVIVDNESGGQEKHILYLEGSPYESNIVYLKGYEESKGSYKFLHKDYLGSILAITDEVGNKLEQRHFDAWGNLTHLLIGSGKVAVGKISVAYTIGAFNGLVVDRGYTGHEHFFDVGIIHMNGRLYDPLLRRFLNADENIQDPANTQNYNKYGYVMNNPMMYNDPDGEFWWWLAGAAAGGYLNGVQANGSWNPGKWNWERTWTAVLGGALGGAAISGALGNIVSNPGTIKTVLPGIVSGGLSSAFTGNNFLGGVVAGLSYSGSLFDNKVTSTDGISSYKYIISPNYNDSSSEVFGENIAGPGDGIISGLTGTVARGISISATGAVATIWYVANTAFGSAHFPNHADWGYRYVARTAPLTISDIKREYKIRDRDQRTGSYTIIFTNNQKYHGKGFIERMFTSAILKMTYHQTSVKSFDWLPSPSNREAFKAEYRRMQTDRIPGLYEQGYMNPINYNILQSPGYKYILQDGY